MAPVPYFVRSSSSVQPHQGLAGALGRSAGGLSEDSDLQPGIRASNWWQSAAGLGVAL